MNQTPATTLKAVFIKAVDTGFTSTQEALSLSVFILGFREILNSSAFACTVEEQSILCRINTETCSIQSDVGSRIRATVVS